MNYKLPEAIWSNCSAKCTIIDLWLIAWGRTQAILSLSPSSTLSAWNEPNQNSVSKRNLAYSWNNRLRFRTDFYGEWTYKKKNDNREEKNSHITCGLVSDGPSMVHKLARKWAASFVRIDCLLSVHLRWLFWHSKHSRQQYATKGISATNLCE